MKSGSKRRKNICKNTRKSPVKNNIYLNRCKKSVSSAFLRRSMCRNSAKESSHVVGKIPHTGGRRQ